MNSSKKKSTFLVIDGSKHGPFTDDEIETFIHSGSVTANSLVLRDNYTQPFPVSQIPEFATHLQSVETAAPILEISVAVASDAQAIETFVPLQAPPMGPAVISAPKKSRSVAVALIFLFIAASFISELKWVPKFLTTLDPYIELVTNGEFSGYPGSPVGKKFNAFLSNPKWETIQADNGQHYVNVTGGMSYYGQNVDAKVQFAVYLDSGKFALEAFEMDGVGQSWIMRAALLKKVLSD